MNNQPNQSIDGPVRPVCRRCKRPLSDPAAIAAGIGARCALQAATDAAQAPLERAPGTGTAEAAVALVAAHLGGLPQPVAAGILDDAPAAELAELLASLAAWMVRHTTGGPEWLHRVGLAWAREGGR